MCCFTDGTHHSRILPSSAEPGGNAGHCCSIQLWLSHPTEERCRKGTEHSFFGQTILVSLTICIYLFLLLDIRQQEAVAEWQEEWWRVGRTHFVFHLSLMLGKLGNGYFKCLTYHLYKQCFVKFKHCSQCLRLFNCNWLLKDLHAWRGWAAKAVIFLSPYRYCWQPPNFCALIKCNFNSRSWKEQNSKFCKIITESDS